MNFLHKKYRLLKKQMFLLKQMFFLSKRLLHKGKKIVLLDTPEHGNLGDHAIAVAERQMIQSVYSGYSFIEFTHKECQSGMRIVKYLIFRNDIALVHGGGFVGSLWPVEHKTFLNILKQLNSKHIIIFPQTAFFYQEDFRLLSEMAETIKQCEHLTFALRDKNSFDLLKSLDLNCKLVFTPDIALSLKGISSNITNGKVLLCLRKDHEKETKTENIISVINESGYQFDITDTVANYEVSIEHSEAEVKKKIDEFSKYELVICDRLHAMIFSILAGTPCIAFDNVSKKVSGVYEWVKDNKNVSCINQADFSKEMICEMIGRGHYKFEGLNYEYFKEIFM